MNQINRPRVVFVADLDSQIFAARPFVEAFGVACWVAIFIVPDLAKLPASLVEDLRSQHCVLELDLDKAAFSLLILDADAVMVFLSGSSTYRFREHVAAASVGSAKRPILLTAFNGLIYEKFEEGLSWRLGYDVICLNGPRDLDAAMTFLKGTSFASQRFLLTGLRPCAKACNEKSKSWKSSLGRAAKTLVFAEQVAAPKAKVERAWLFLRLNALAAASPGWNVLLRPRIQPGEKTFHSVILRPEDVLTRSMRAQNLEIVGTPLPELLDDADALLTVSSTAYFDALAHGVPAYAVADFGVRTEIGTHLFVFSNTQVWLEDLKSFDDLPTDEPSAAWRHALGACGAFAPRILLEFIQSSEIQKNTPLIGLYSGRKLPLPQRFTSVDRTETNPQTWQNRFTELFKPVGCNAHASRVSVSGTRLQRALLGRILRARASGNGAAACEDKLFGEPEGLRGKVMSKQTAPRHSKLQALLTQLRMLLKRPFARSKKNDANKSIH